MSKLFRCCTVAALTVWAFASVGCGGEDKPKDPVYKYPDVGAYCNAYAKAQCSTPVATACAVDQGNCVVKRQAKCDIKTGKYRPLAAETCVEAVRLTYEDGILKGTELAELAKKCSVVFGGSGTKGSPCTQPSDCDLDQKYDCIRGTCQVPASTPAEPGGDCNTDDAICKEGYYCSAADKKCVTNQAKGAACGDAKPCKAELNCVKAAPADESGTCNDKLGDGDTACTADSQCSGGVCILISAADPDGGTASMRCGSQNSFSPTAVFCSEVAAQ